MSERFDDLSGGMDRDEQHRTDTIKERTTDVSEDPSSQIQIETNYTPEIDRQFYRVVPNPSDVNPRIKINYSTGNVYRTTGPSRLQAARRPRWQHAPPVPVCDHRPVRSAPLVPNRHGVAGRGAREERLRRRGLPRDMLAPRAR